MVERDGGSKCWASLHSGHDDATSSVELKQRQANTQCKIVTSSGHHRRMFFLCSAIHTEKPHFIALPQLMHP